MRPIEDLWYCLAVKKLNKKRINCSAHETRPRRSSTIGRLDDVGVHIQTNRRDTHNPAGKRVIPGYGNVSRRRPRPSHSTRVPKPITRSSWLVSSPQTTAEMPGQPSVGRCRKRARCTEDGGESCQEWDEHKQHLTEPVNIIPSPKQVRQSGLRWHQSKDNRDPDDSQSASRTSRTWGPSQPASVLRLHVLLVAVRHDDGVPAEAFVKVSVLP
ncbi:hypothetical protein C8R45DRAFT_1022712 [Mycena sanguinolenta]|nr:hypothetical protein C8R45DRAFT_1022712 [Mycena sanguinolenta]